MVPQNSYPEELRVVEPDPGATKKIIPEELVWCYGTTISTNVYNDRIRTHVGYSAITYFRKPTKV